MQGLFQGGPGGAFAPPLPLAIGFPYLEYGVAPSWICIYMQFMFANLLRM